MNKKQKNSFARSIVSNTADLKDLSKWVKKAKNYYENQELNNSNDMGPNNECPGLRFSSREYHP